jgi:hypothetical protein
LQQFVEVVPAARFLEPGIVEDEALDQVFLEVDGGPLAELCAARGADTVADGQDEVEVVELGAVALAVGGSLLLMCKLMFCLLV